jgi:hypothetical protein
MLYWSVIFVLLALLVGVVGTAEAPRSFHIVAWWVAGGLVALGVATFIAGLRHHRKWML